MDVAGAPRSPHSGPAQAASHVAPASEDYFTFVPSPAPMAPPLAGHYAGGAALAPSPASHRLSERRTSASRSASTKRPTFAAIDYHASSKSSKGSKQRLVGPPSPKSPSTQALQPPSSAGITQAARPMFWRADTSFIRSEMALATRVELAAATRHDASLWPAVNLAMLTAARLGLYFGTNMLQQSTMNRDIDLEKRGVLVTSVACTSLLAAALLFFRDLSPMGRSRAIRLQFLAMLSQGLLVAGHAINIFSIGRDIFVVRDIGLIVTLAGEGLQIGFLPYTFSTSELKHGNVTNAHRDVIQRVAIIIGCVLFVLSRALLADDRHFPEWASELTGSLANTAVVIGVGMGATDKVRKDDFRNVEVDLARQRRSSVVRELAERSLSIFESRRRPQGRLSE